MARKRTGFSLVEWLVILSVNTVLIVMLALTVRRVQQTMAEGPRDASGTRQASAPVVRTPRVRSTKPYPPASPRQGKDVERAGSEPNVNKGLTVSRMAGIDEL